MYDAWYKLSWNSKIKDCYYNARFSEMEFLNLGLTSFYKYKLRTNRQNHPNTYFFLFLIYATIYQESIRLKSSYITALQIVIIITLIISKCRTFKVHVTYYVHKFTSWTLNPNNKPQQLLFEQFLIFSYNNNIFFRYLNHLLKVKMCVSNRHS